MRKIPAIWLGITAAAAFGIATPVSKTLLRRVDTFQLAGLLYLGAALGLLPFILKKGAFRSIFHMGRSNFLKTGGAVLFGGILGPVFLLFGLRSAMASSVSLWLNLELAATALLGVLFFRDHLALTGWLSAAGVIIAGILIAVPEGSSGIRSALWITAACFSWGFDNHFTALIDGITPVQSTFIKGAVAGTVNLSIGLIIHPVFPAVGIIGAALGIGVLSYGASIVLYITSAQHLGATRSQIVFASAPFFGMIFSIILLSEMPSVLQLIAAGILICSILLMSRTRHEHFHDHPHIEHVHMHDHEDGHHDHGHEEAVREQSVHIHRHRHDKIQHSHSHVPDLHHRHDHDKEEQV